MPDILANIPSATAEDLRDFERCRITWTQLRRVAAHYARRAAVLEACIRGLVEHNGDSRHEEARKLLEAK